MALQGGGIETGTTPHFKSNRIALFICCRATIHNNKATIVTLNRMKLFPNAHSDFHKYQLDRQVYLEFGIVDALFIHSMVDAIDFGVVNQFTCKKRVNNTKFKANLTVEAVCIHFYEFHTDIS